MKTCINGASTMPYALEEDLRSAAAAGFEGVELWTAKVETYLKSHGVEELDGTLRELGLTPEALCPYGLVSFGENVEENVAKIEEVAKLAEDLSCPILLVCPDVPPSDVGEVAAIKKAGAMARKLGKICADHHASIAIEPLGRHPFVPGPKQALRIIAEADHPNVKLMMDTFHYYKSDVPISDIAAIPIERLAIVHINDCEDLPKAQLTDGHRLWPGEGVIPLREMIGAIRDNGYEDALSVEVFRKAYWEEDVDWIARNAKKSLDAFLASL